MAKKFMYVCLGILALTVAFHLGARCGQAGYVDQSTIGIVAFTLTDVLLDNGEVWHRNHPTDSWEQEPYLTLPMPVEEIKFWSPTRFITRANEMWFFSDGWQNLGSPPGLVVTEPTTWGQIKAEFGE